MDVRHVPSGTVTFDLPASDLHSVIVDTYGHVHIFLKGDQREALLDRIAVEAKVSRLPAEAGGSVRLPHVTLSVL